MGRCRLSNPSHDFNTYRHRKIPKPSLFELLCIEELYAYVREWSPDKSSKGQQNVVKPTLIHCKRRFYFRAPIKKSIEYHRGEPNFITRTTRVYQNHLHNLSCDQAAGSKLNSAFHIPISMSCPLAPSLTKKTFVGTDL